MFPRKLSQIVFKIAEFISLGLIHKVKIDTRGLKIDCLPKVI